MTPDDMRAMRQSLNLTVEQTAEIFDVSTDRWLRLEGDEEDPDWQDAGLFYMIERLCTWKPLGELREILLDRENGLKRIFALTREHPACDPSPQCSSFQLTARCKR